MEGLWCDAVLLHLTLVSCAFDLACDQQTQRRYAYSNQSQKHPRFSSTLTSTRFRRSLRGFFVRLYPLLQQPLARRLTVDSEVASEPSVSELPTIRELS